MATEQLRQSPEFFWIDPKKHIPGAFDKLYDLPYLQREPLTFNTEATFSQTAALLVSSERLLITMLMGREPATTLGVMNALKKNAPGVFEDADFGRGAPIPNLIYKITNEPRPRQRNKIEEEGADLIRFDAARGEENRTAFFIGNAPVVRRDDAGPKIIRLQTNPEMPNGNLLATALVVSEARAKFQKNYGVGLEKLLISEYGRNSTELARYELLQRIYNQTTDDQSTYEVRDLFPTAGFSRQINRSVTDLAEIELGGLCTEQQLLSIEHAKDYLIKPSEKAMREYAILQDLGFFNPDDVKVIDTTTIFANPVQGEGGININRIMLDTIGRFAIDGECSIDIDTIIESFKSNFEKMHTGKQIKDADIKALLYKTCERKPGFEVVSPFEFIKEGEHYKQLRIATKIQIIDHDEDIIIRSYKDLQPNDKLSVNIEWRKRVIEEWLTRGGDNWLTSSNAREIYNKILSERGMQMQSRYEDHYKVRNWSANMDKTPEEEPKLTITTGQRKVIKDILDIITGLKGRYSYLTTEQEGQDKINALFGEDFDIEGVRKLELPELRADLIKILAKELREYQHRLDVVPH